MAHHIGQDIVTIYFDPLLVFTRFAEFFVFAVIYLVHFALELSWYFLTYAPIA